MPRKKEALSIVAHPDDETIWMGGTMIKNKDWNWTIISLCRKKDIDRSSKFKNVCKFYKAKSLISNLDDETLKPLKISFVIKKMREIIPNMKYDILFTHGKNGEYGHIRHKEIHKAVKKMVKNKEITAGEVLYFSYELKNNSKIPSPSNFYDLSTKLSEKEFNSKLKLITKYYGFKADSFEALSSNKIETFSES